MCGIIGLFGFPFHNAILHRKAFMEDGLFVTSLRGLDSTGIAAIPRAKGADPRVYKKDISGPDFIFLPKFTKLMSDANSHAGYIGHCRAPTYKNDVSSITAHPFQHKHITLVHNGHINNMKELTTSCKIEVDSAYIAHAMAENPASVVLPKLRGAFSLVWWDRDLGTLNFARNDERPMYLHFDWQKDTLYFASEYTMLFLAAERNNIKLSKDVLETSPMVHYSFGNISKVTEYKKEGFTTAPFYAGSHIHTAPNRAVWEPTKKTTSVTPTTETGTTGTKPIAGSGRDVKVIYMKGSAAHGEHVPEELLKHVIVDDLKCTSDPERVKSYLNDLGVPQKGTAFTVKPVGWVPYFYREKNNNNEEVPVAGLRYSPETPPTHMGAIIAKHNGGVSYVMLAGKSMEDYRRLITANLPVTVTAVAVCTSRHQSVSRKGATDSLPIPMVRFLPIKTDIVEEPAPSTDTAESATEELFPVYGKRRLVPYKEFLEITNTGCVNCSTYFNRANCHTIIWKGPHNEYPFCQECGKDPQIVNQLTV